MSFTPEFQSRIDALCPAYRQFLAKHETEVFISGVVVLYGHDSIEECNATNEVAEYLPDESCGVWVAGKTTSFMKTNKSLTMHNVGIVVENLDAAIEFFAELGLELEGRAPIEGPWADGITGLRDMRVEIAMMRTPDGHSRLELSRFLAPPVVADHRTAPVNALGYLRVMFNVEDLDDTLARLRKLGAEVVGEVVNYEDIYRLCYIRGPEGILIGLAQDLGERA